MSSNRERRRDARLETILATAQALLARDGIDGLTLQRLADELAITPAAIYRYVTSKHELVTKLQAASLDELTALVTTSIAAWKRSSLVDGVPPRVRPMILILALGLLYVRLREEDSLHVQLMSVLVGDPRPLVPDEWARQVMPRWQKLLGEIAQVISEAEAAGAIEPGPATERAALLWTSMQAAAQTHKLRRLAPKLFAPTTMVLELGAGLLGRWGARATDLDMALETTQRLRLRVPAR